MRKEIKYIGFYDLNNSKIKRVSALSAINKMNYVAKSLNCSGHNVKFVSPSWFEEKEKKFFYQKSLTEKISDSQSVTFSPTFTSKNKILEKIKIFLSLFWLFYWLLFNVKKNEKLLIYHSPWLFVPLMLIKKIKRCKFVLEVEEIYQKVWTINKTLTRWENNLINLADSFIVVSDVLSTQLPNKPKVILYGSYSLPENYNVSNNEGLIKVVYAGAIEDTRGGAFQIVESAIHLPENYEVAILGYGSEEMIRKLLVRINHNNTILKRTACVFEGVKSGNELSEFLLNCDIGVNPQFTGDYMSTAFPSKILTYLSHNLQVVSTHLESIEKSSISNYVHFSQDDSPKSIASAILKVPNLKTDNSSVINELNNNFVRDLNLLFENDLILNKYEK